MNSENSGRAPQLADKFVLRLPDGMREQIAARAKENNRSMNAEIVYRLALSLDPANVDLKNDAGPKAEQCHEEPSTEQSQSVPAAISNEDISRLAKAVSDAVGKRVALVVPGSLDLWDTSDVATYLKRSANTVRTEIVVQPSFPRPIRLPGTAKPQALYIAREVVRWAESFQQPSRARKTPGEPTDTAD